MGPGHPPKDCAGAVKGASGVANAMGFAHPGMEALPLGLAGYQAGPEDWRTAGSARLFVPGSALESVRRHEDAWQPIADPQAL
jgi:hypothetical protein